MVYIRASPGAGKKGSHRIQNPSHAAQPPQGHTSPMWHPRCQSHQPTLQRNSKTGKHLLRLCTPATRPPLGPPWVSLELEFPSALSASWVQEVPAWNTPLAALHPPVQHSKISNLFNESSSKIIPLKSLRPWQQLTPDPSSLLLFYLLMFKNNNITNGANYFPA